MAHSPSSTTTPEEAVPERRGFFNWIIYGLGAAAAALVAIPFVGYLFGSRKKPDQWLKIGAVDSFLPGETNLVTFQNPIRLPWDGIVAHTGVFVRREDKDQFLVFLMNCAHLGCGVSWFPESGLFLCPCHGGVYYANGERASGPPPHGLYKCAYRVRAGQLEIQPPFFPTLRDPYIQG